MLRLVSTIISLKRNTNFLRYVRNTSWMMGEQVLRIIASLFVGFWVARYLGPKQFGQYSYVLAFNVIFSSPVKLGLDGIVIRELINHPENRTIYLGTSFWLKVLSAFFLILVVLLILFYSNHVFLTKIFILIVSIGLLFQSFEVVEFHFQSLVKAKVLSICKSIQLAISSLIKIFLVLFEVKLIWFVLVILIDLITLSIAYIAAYRLGNYYSFYKSFSFRIAISLLKNSFPIMLSTMLIAVYMKCDVLMINYFYGEKFVGIYTAGTRIIESMYFIPIIIVASIFPALVESKKISEKKYYSSIQNLYTLMVWLGVIITIIIFFTKDFLIKSLFGIEFQDSGKILGIYSLIIIPLFLSVANDKWFVVENKGYLLTLKIFTGSVFSIIFNYFLIPKYGLLGAAYSTVISFYISVIISDIFFRSQHKILFLKLKAFLPVYIFKNFYK